MNENCPATASSLEIDSDRKIEPKDLPEPTMRQIFLDFWKLFLPALIGRVSE